MPSPVIPPLSPQPTSLAPSPSLSPSHTHHSPGLHPDLFRGVLVTRPVAAALPSGADSWKCPETCLPAIFLPRPRSLAGASCTSCTSCRDGGPAVALSVFEGQEQWLLPMRCLQSGPADVLSPILSLKKKGNENVHLWNSLKFLEVTLISCCSPGVDFWRRQVPNRCLGNRSDL